MPRAITAALAGAAIRRREWMSDPPRVAEELIAARLGRKLSILCLDSWQGTMPLDDYLKWIGMCANTEVSAQPMSTELG